MTGIVYHSLIQQHQVLIRTTAPYIKTRLALTSRLYAGQELYGFQYIRLTKYYRQFFDFFCSQSNGPHLCTTYIFICTLCGDHYLFEVAVILILQVCINGGIVIQVEVNYIIFQSHAAVTDGISTRFQTQGIEPVRIRSGTFLGFCGKYICTDQGFSVGAIFNITAYGYSFLCQQRYREHYDEQ
ncbi:hypothetical protein D3C72_983200 [compost metagenome]